MREAGMETTLVPRALREGACGGLEKPPSVPKEVMLEPSVARGAGICQADTWKRKSRQKVNHMQICGG